MGLFTIIVLGEVVVGVVGGISDAEHRDLLTITTGMVGLTIGMGMWWNYFDMLGRRVPGQRGRRLASWLYSHLPLTMGISASGAAMVSLLEHAGESRTPAATGWLLVGSVVIVLGSVTLACTALPPDEFPDGMARYIAPSFAAAAAVIVVIGLVRPAPLIMVSTISAVLLLVWLALFGVFLALGGDPDVTDFELGHDGGHQSSRHVKHSPSPSPIPGGNCETPASISSRCSASRPSGGRGRVGAHAALDGGSTMSPSWAGAAPTARTFVIGLAVSPMFQPVMYVLRSETMPAIARRVRSPLMDRLAERAFQRLRHVRCEVHDGVPGRGEQTAHAPEQTAPVDVRADPQGVERSTT